jgi:transposase
MPVFDFTEEVAEKALEKCRKLRFWKIFQRLLFVMLKVKGYSNDMIADILSVSVTTTFNWQHIFREEGLEALATLHYKGQPSALNAYGTQLAFELDKNPVATLKEAQDRIEKATGLKRSLPQIRAFFQRLKLRRRKVGQVPSKANLEAQERFQKEQLEPLIKQAQSHRIRLLFVDAAHFVHLPFLGYLYGWTRKFIRSASGRKRFNVLAALDAITHTLTTICNETYITATTVCQLLELLAKQYVGEKIHVILDNAPYQRCLLVQQTAAALGIHLVFLEPYSPHLNLIERLWRFVKGKVLYNKFYAKSEDFKGAVVACLEKVVHGEYANELQSLLTLQFQSFVHSKINP